MGELLAVPAIARGLAALVASAIAFPAIGTVILGLELVGARFAVMHVSLLGAAVAIAFGADPTAGALVAALLSGLLIARLGERGGGSAGGPLGLVMTLSIALAFIIFYKSEVNAIEAFNLFWGNVLALGKVEVGLVAAAAVAVPVLLVLFFHPIAAVLYDRELAAASGFPARAVYYGLIVASCLGVGIAMRLTGALMADATTILPALAARNLKRGLGGTLAAGSVIALIANLGGFALSFALDLPVSPAVIVVAAAAVFATGAYAKRGTRGGARKTTAVS